jgi:DNA helicase HerA-like ATPase
VVRLIRSKGVGVYFVSQSPTDLPDVVLGQLGNRVQHALRAFTPRDQKAVRAAAETFRASPGLDVKSAIVELAVGEALLSFLDADGMPTPVARALVRPPGSRIGAITDAERARLIAASPLRVKYQTTVDRESAYECLRDRASRPVDPAAASVPSSRAPGDDEARPRRRGSERDSVGEAMMKSAARSLASAVGRQLGGSLGAKIARGVLGSLLGSRG